MPLLDFNPENKNESGIDYPKLKLELGEYARILVIDKVPTYAYAHTLRAPKILNGEPVKKTVNRKDGSSFTDFVKDFIGQPQCLGDLGIMRDKGADPRNCPLCARAQESGEIDQAKRRFAQHVIQYSTKNGGWDLRYPHGVDLVVWAYTDMIYNKLNNISNQYGNLRARDLLLGPCTDKDYQKFEIMVGPDAAWQKDEQLKAMVLATYKENRYAGDLENFCGRKTDRAFMERDIERIAERWRAANRTSAPARADGTERATVNPALAAGLDGLDAAPQQPASQPAGQNDWLVDAGAADAIVAQQQADQQRAAQRATAQAPAIDFDDLLGPGTAPAETAAAVAPVSASPASAPPAAPTAAPASAPVDEFDDLLNAVGS